MAFRRGEGNRKWKNPGRSRVKRFTDLWRGKVTVGEFILDSGAHSLYNKHVLDKGMGGINREGLSDDVIYAWFDKKAFRRYMDDYAAYVKKNLKGIDHYVTCDVIFNPQKSWDALKYLENEHGLKPMPVIHYLTPVKWVEKHIEAGYDYIGVGGLGQEITRHTYIQWADKVFDCVCDQKDRLPRVKVHGFAVAAYKLLIRYPWYSVDSASWCKMALNGCVYVPHFRDGKFVFDEEPYLLATDDKAVTLFRRNKHYMTLGEQRLQLFHDWMEEIGVPVGKSVNGKRIEHGVVNNYGLRATANLKFFDRLRPTLPEWPWPFKKRRERRSLL